MNSKAVYAVVIVAIVIIAGVAAYFLLNKNGGSTPSEKTDVLDTDIEAGDYITLSIEASGGTSQEVSQSEFLEIMYPETSYLELTGQEYVLYKGQNVLCNVYGYSGLMSYYISENGVMYSSVISYSEESMTTTLTESTMDLTKTKSQQTFKEGDVFIMSASIAGVPTVTKYTATSYNGSEWVFTLTIEASTVQEMTKMVASVSGSSITLTDGSKVTTADYLSDISYENLLKYMKETGIDYELGDKTSETISTVYGDRQTTVQIIKYDESGDEMTFKVWYSGDIIYKLQIEGSQDGTSAVQTTTLAATSHITPAN